MKQFQKSLSETGWLIRRHGFLAVVLLTFLAAPTSSELAAQESDCAIDNTIASALDEFQLQWSVSKGRAGTEDALGGSTSTDGYWQRVTDESYDNADSLRSGPVGNNEHMQLHTRVMGPATLIFFWKVESEENSDFMTFLAAPESEDNASHATEEQNAEPREISGSHGWMEVITPLSRETAYDLIWTYEKDMSGQAGTDAGWIDKVQVIYDKDGSGTSPPDTSQEQEEAITREGYIEISMHEPQIEGNWVRLSWPTVPCRYYQVWWRSRGSIGEWKPMLHDVKPAEGSESSPPDVERLARFREREYRVTLIEPPSFTLLPQNHSAAFVEGESLELAYEVTGSGSIQFAWHFRARSAEQAVLLSTTDGNYDIELTDRKAILRIDPISEVDEGDYTLVAEHVTGNESAPVFSLKVFHAPTVSSFLVLTAGAHERRIELNTEEASAVPEVAVDEGQSLTIEVDVSSDEPIEGIWWERKKTASGEWQRLSEGLQLHLKNVASETGGQYQVVAKNRWGSSKQSVQIAVTVAPRIQRIMLNQEQVLAAGHAAHPIEVTRYDSVSLSVEVDGTVPLSYKWYRHGKLVSEEVGGRSSAVTVSTDKVGFISFKVIVKNSAGFDQIDTIEIFVTSPPAVMKVVVDAGETTGIQGKRIDARQFDPITLTVEADGTPELSYQWYRNDDEPVPASEGGDSPTVTVSTYSDGSFTYHARVRNNQGEDLSAVYEINVAPCPGAIFQGYVERSPSTAADCSFDAGLKKEITLQHAEDWQLRTIACAYGALGDHDAALQVAKRIPVGEWMRTLADLCLSTLMARHGDIPGALRVAAHVEYAGPSIYYRLRALSNIAIAQANAGDNAGAEDTFKRAMRLFLEHYDPSKAGYAGEGDGELEGLVITQAKIGGLNAALALANARGIKNSNLRHRAVRLIIAAGFETADIETAKNLAEELDNVGDKITALSHIVIAQVEAGTESGANDTLKEIMEILEREQENARRPSLLVETAIAHSVVGNNADARALLDEAWRYTESTTDAEEKAYGWNDIAIAEAWIGNVPAARKALGMVGDEPSGGTYIFVRSLDDLLGRIVRARAKAGDMTQAQQILDHIKHGLSRTFALNSIARSFALAGNKKEALKFFSKAYEALGSKRNIPRNASLVLPAQSGAGFLAEALQKSREIGEVRKGLDSLLYRHKRITTGMLSLFLTEDAYIDDIGSAIEGAYRIEEANVRATILAGIVGVIASRNIRHAE